MPRIRINPDSEDAWIIKALGQQEFDIAGSTPEEIDASFSALRQRASQTAIDRDRQNQDSFDAALKQPGLGVSLQSFSEYTPLTKQGKAAKSQQEKTVKSGLQQRTSNRIKSLNEKTANAYSLEDTVDIYKNYDAYKQAGLKSVPSWLKQKHQARIDEESKYAKEAASLVSGIRDEFTDVLGLVTDEERKKGISEYLSKQGKPKEIQEAAKKGVEDNRAKKLQKQIEGLRSAGVPQGREKEIGDQIAGITVETDPYQEFKDKSALGFALDSPRILGDAVARLKSALGAQKFKVDDKEIGLPEEIKSRSLAVLERAIKDGHIDAETGSYNPNWWLATVAGKAGLKGLPDYSTPIGPKLKGVVLNSTGLAAQASSDFEKTIGPRAKRVLDAASPGDAVYEALNNTYDGFADNVQGIMSLAAWDTEPTANYMRKAYESYVKQTEGARPILGFEQAMLNEEASTQMGGQLIAGMKEGVKRLFTDSATAFAGDPFNSIANLVGLARLVNAGLAPLPDGADGAKFKAQAGEFLKKVDDVVNGTAFVNKGIELAKPAVKKVLDTPAVKDIARKARTWFSPYTDQEIAVKNARSVGQKAVSQVEQIYENIQKAKDRGVPERQAAIEAIDKASPEGASFFAKEIIRDKIFRGLVDNPELMVNKIEDPVGAAKAYLNDSVVDLKKHIKEEDLAVAGYQPTFSPRGMYDAPTVKGKKDYETVEVDSTMLAKELDVRIDEMPKSVQEDLFRRTMRIKARLRSGQKMVYPEFRPMEMGGVIRVSQLNPLVDNFALLAAMVDEAKGAPVPVSIRKQDKSMIMGPLAGPKQIIDAIPEVWRTRRGAEFYKNRSTRDVQQLLKDFKEDVPNDYALYLKRARNQNRTNEVNAAAFEELEKLFLESTGLKKDDFYTKTTLGGLSKSVDDYMDELVVRRSYRLPGAATAVPSLYGVGRVTSELGMRPTKSGKQLRPVGPASTATPPGSLDLVQQTVLSDIPRPQQTRLDIPVGLSQRNRQMLAMKETPDRAAFQSAVEEMEAGRIAERDKIVSQMGPEAPFDVEAQSLVEDLLKRSSKFNEGLFAKKLEARSEVLKSAQRQALEAIRERSLRDTRMVLSGMDWDPKQLNPMLFEGAPEQVAARMIESQGEKGQSFVSKMEIEDANDSVRNSFALPKDGAFSVPAYVNDAFQFLVDTDNFINSENKMRKLSSAVKRWFTTRSIGTFANNNMSNIALRALATGRLGAKDLGLSIRDIQSYLKGGRKQDADASSLGLSPQRYEMLKIMDQKGVFDSDVLSREVMDSKLSAMPSDYFQQVLEGVGADKLSKPVAAYNRAMNKLEKGYNLSDVVFKADHVFDSSARFRSNLDALMPGEFVDVPVGKAYTQRVYRSSDGKFKLGGEQGPELFDSDLRRISTEQAIVSANDMYFDYSDIPKIMDRLRATGYDSMLINPFFTWAWKAMYIPFVKKGLAGQVLTGGKNYKTNSRAFRQARNRSILGNELKRQLLLLGGTSMSRKQTAQTQKNKALRILSRFSKDTPYRGIASYALNDSILIGTSGIDFSGANDPLQGMLKKALPAETLGAPVLGDKKEVVSTWADGLKNDAERGFLAEMIKNNPDYEEYMVTKVRSAFPLSQYDTIEATARTLQAGQSLLFSLYDHYANTSPGETKFDATMQLAVGALVGSKDIPKVIKAFKKNSDPSEALAAIFGKRRLDNNVFNLAMDSIAKDWRGNAKDALDLDERPSGGKEEYDYSMKIKMMNAVIRREMQSFYDNVQREAEEAGMQIEKKATRPRFVGALRAEQIRRGE